VRDFFVSSFVPIAPTCVWAWAWALIE
jgi:hypothetical protein